MCQDDVAAARPDIDQRTEQLVSRHRWHGPQGYKASLPRHLFECETVLTTSIGEIRRSLSAISGYRCGFPLSYLLKTTSECAYSLLANVQPLEYSRASSIRIDRRQDLRLRRVIATLNF